MNQLQLFLPCAAGVEGYLADEVHAITGLTGHDLLTGRGGVLVRASWRDAMRLNLHSRLAQRVLVQLAHRPYRNEGDLYGLASGVAWEIWFTTRQSFKIEVTAQHSPLNSLNFAALKVKDAVADRFRAKGGARPDVNTQWPDVRIHLHLTTDEATIYIDTSGEALFKRGWREDKGDAPLKETLAAAMIAASGWDPLGDAPVPLYDPCWAAAPSPSRPRRSPAAFRPACSGASRSKSCCPSRPMSGLLSRPKRKAPSSRRLRRFSAVTCRTAWWTSPSATPSVRAWPRPCSCAAATRCSACRPPSSPACCC